MRQNIGMALSIIGLFDSIFIQQSIRVSLPIATCIQPACDLAKFTVYGELARYPLPSLGMLMFGFLIVLFALESVWGLRIGYSVILAESTIASAGSVASAYLIWQTRHLLGVECLPCDVEAFLIVCVCLLCVAQLMSSAKRPSEMSLPGLKRQLLVLSMSMFVGGLAFATSSKQTIKQDVPAGVLTFPTSGQLVRSRSHIEGPSDASVRIVEFADIECPICRRQSVIINQILKKYGGQVSFTYRQFPLTSIHPHAEEAAEASECMALQGKFWSGLDKLYLGQRDLEMSALESYAIDAGANVGQFRLCMDARATRTQISGDLADGRALGVEATPTLFVNQRRIVGLTNYDNLASIIEQDLRVK